MQYQSNETVPIFVNKLYQIMNEDNFDEIIGWVKDGKQFEIRNVEGLQESVLPKYFRHNKVNSFIRQLNMYGFHKSRKDPSKTIFSHPQFIKNHPQLLQKIQRRIKTDNPPEGNDTFKSQIDSTIAQISKLITIKEQDSDMLSQIENNIDMEQKNQAVEGDEEESVKRLYEFHNSSLWMIEDEKGFMFDEEKGPSTLKCFMDKSIVFDPNPDVYSPKQYRITVDNQDEMNMNDCQSDDDGTSLAGDIQLLDYEDKLDDSVARKLFQQ